MVAALVALRRTESLPAGEVVLAAVADEEMQSLGTERLVIDGFRADGAVVGEPTANRLALGHRGLEWLEIEITGRSAHGGHPEAGVNAIVAAARFVSLVEERLLPRLLERRHPLLGPPTFNVGTIRGGDQPSTVAGTCRLAVDRRTVPGETYEAVVGELGALLDEVRDTMPGLRWDLRRMPGGMATLEHRPSVCDGDHPLARAARSAIEASAGYTEPGTAFPAWTDAALLSNFAGIPSIVLGPGELALAHTPRESIAVGDVERAARIYARTAMRFCAEDA
jgi:acetylornithine deacetylase/succinyl-diaminopimelate desuccinylase